jgi:hypothetical protein
MSTVETMRFICGGCGYRARIPSSYTGKVILCPGCQQMQIASADGGEATGDTVRVSRVATAQGGTGRFSMPDADGRLAFTCSGCGYSAKLASTYAGKAISCPQCKAPQLIPPLQGTDGGAGKAVPSPALEPAAAKTAAPAADEGLTFEDEPAKPAVTPPKPPAATAPAVDDGISFDDEPVDRRPADGSDNDATKPTAAASAKSTAPKVPAKPSTRPGSGGVVRRGSRVPLPATPEPTDGAGGEEDRDDQRPVEPPKPMPPWAQKLKEPRVMGVAGGALVALILVVVLISGWAGASSRAEEFRAQAESNGQRVAALEQEKAAAEFNLSKATEDLNRVRKSESEVKAALATAQARVAELGEQVRKADADKASEYALRKKAEADHDDLFAKLKALERKRDEEYRIATELRRKYEEEAKLRKDLKVRLEEAQAAAK